ncbi:UDP-N-acetylmuramoylalanyl-D-glutamate--2,6-diaminopimelate ligase [Staphylococcus aureus]|uniref:UDP-N-acetylmuramoylalanyl-D-glutamate--2,6-diaminopimelate ligase n=1 Tax=Staphylococcus aureus TaxID=1280 RepID=A0A380E211_STAAU|nr:UDP-N-acetylmuramoylalanyl-D-glutamate--2,6-diaminopimelate ligase [Staphylococcus aureus]
MAGERDLTKTPEMGRVACRADYVIFTPDNPANDDPKMLTAELAKGATHQNYIEFDDRAEGIKHAIDIAEPGDTVVLASKGREPYQIMPGHIKVPHRDDLIGLEAAYKSSVVALLVNKRLIDEGKTIDVYLFEALNDQIIIAIPDWFWSYQMAMTLDEETCFEAILMQLFVFKEEEEAESIASQLTDWIETYKRRKTNELKQEVESRKTFAIIHIPMQGKQR